MSSIPVVVQLVQELLSFGQEVLQGLLQELVVASDKVTVNEGCRLVELVVVRDDVEHVVLHTWVFLLDLFFDNKGHKAEGQAEVLVQNVPVVVFSVETVPHLVRDVIKCFVVL